MTYCDAIGTQRFESCKTSNKKEAEHRLVDRRKEAMEGLLPAPPIQPLALEDLQERYLSFVGHQRGVATKQIHFAHFTRVWGNPLIHMLTVEVLDRVPRASAGESGRGDDQPGNGHAETCPEQGGRMEALTQDRTGGINRH
jgi:hypothetical protein